MAGIVLIDSGPIVAVLNKRDVRHAWAARHFEDYEGFITCEAVLSEVFFLLRADSHATAKFCAILEEGVLTVRSLGQHLSAIAQLIRRYSNLPMSYADACLVRLAELDDTATVFTTDSDFRVYRKHGHQVIPLLSP